MSLAICGKMSLFLLYFVLRSNTERHKEDGKEKALALLCEKLGKTGREGLALS